MSRVTAVIADDEPLLRARLRAHLSRLWPELDVVREMENGRDIDAVIDEHKPALFFLDIHMPGVNGLEAAHAIGCRAHVVFVTASVLLAFGFALWCFQAAPEPGTGRLVAGAVSVLVGLGLVGYEAWFLKKMRSLP